MIFIYKKMEVKTRLFFVFPPDLVLNSLDSGSAEGTELNVELNYSN